MFWACLQPKPTPIVTLLPFALPQDLGTRFVRMMVEMRMFDCSVLFRRATTRSPVTCSTEVKIVPFVPLADVHVCGLHDSPRQDFAVTIGETKSGDSRIALDHIDHERNAFGDLQSGLFATHFSSHPTWCDQQ
jgi:hypothetical protein